MMPIAERTAMQTSNRAAPIALVLAATAIVALGSAQQLNRPRSFAISGARIVTGAGPSLADATIVFSDGIIREVGAGAAVPAGAWVIDGEGLTVYPGLIDALSPLAAPPSTPNTDRARAPNDPDRGPISAGPQDRPATTSWIVAADGVRPADERIAKWRNVGVLTAAAAPGNGIFPGHVSWIQTAGERVGEMTLAERAALLVRIPDEAEGYRGFPASLLGRIAYIKQTFLDARHYQAAQSIYREDPQGLERPSYDLALEPIAAALAERLAVLYPADSAIELKRAINLAAETKLPLVAYGGRQADEVATELAQAGLAVLVNTDWPASPPDPDPEADIALRELERRERAPSSPAALARAGVRFAFYSGDEQDPDKFLAGVRKAVAAGLSKQDAARALTLSAAEIYGLDDRIGSLEVGKIANLIVVEGDLFDSGARPKMVFVDGRKFNVPAAPKKPADKEDQQ
jgi:hypothetical protein